jgi:hypothetical protein
LSSLTIPRGERSLAEAEGMGDWEARYGNTPQPKPTTPIRKNVPKAAQERRLSLDDARAVARALRNRRDWENKG